MGKPTEFFIQNSNNSNNNNNNSNISVYNESLYLQKYIDYIVLVHLACPPLLYDDPCFQLFRQVTGGILFIEIFRDSVS